MLSRQTIELIRLALAEDIGPGDLTTEMTVPGGKSCRARIVAKQDLVVAGLESAAFTFTEVDPLVKFRTSVRDGDKIDNRGILADLEGPASSILIAERVALNLLMRLSGVATQTAHFVAAVKGSRARIVDTRKTTPGLRALEKAAVRAGGGFNHRFALYRRHPDQGQPYRRCRFDYQCH